VHCYPPFLPRVAEHRVFLRHHRVEVVAEPDGNLNPSHRPRHFARKKKIGELDRYRCDHRESRSDRVTGTSPPPRVQIGAPATALQKTTQDRRKRRPPRREPVVMRNYRCDSDRWWREASPLRCEAFCDERPDAMRTHRRRNHMR